MPFLNIFYACKAFKTERVAPSHAAQGFGVSECFVYSV
jgi:hypothetical protein